MIPRRGLFRGLCSAFALLFVIVAVVITVAHAVIAR